MARLQRAFSVEIAQGLIDGVSARSPVAVIAVVGEGMVGTPGISARVFSALAAGGVNVVAIAQGSSERNISFVVSSADARAAMQRVHDTFQLSKIGGGRAKAAALMEGGLLGFGRAGCRSRIRSPPVPATGRFASSSCLIVPDMVRRTWPVRFATLPLPRGFRRRPWPPSVNVGHGRARVRLHGWTRRIAPGCG